MTTEQRKAFGYTYVLHMTKRFVNGALEGLTIEDTIGFCSEQTALDYQQWTTNLTTTERAKWFGVDYVVEKTKVEKL